MTSETLLLRFTPYILTIPGYRVYKQWGLRKRV